MKYKMQCKIKQKTLINYLVNKKHLIKLFYKLIV